MKLNDLYYALSGEGVHVGVPVTLVRTQSCNLNCRWCDTQYAQASEGGLGEVSTEGIIAKASPYRWVLITGGEPLLQLAAVHELVRALKRSRIKVEVETNGSIAPPTWWREVDCWSVDAKCPSSGMHSTFCRSWLGSRERDQIKFVVNDEADLEFARKTFMFTDRLLPTILISPTYPWSTSWARRCVAFCLCHGTRLSLQQHKIIFGEERRV